MSKGRRMLVCHNIYYRRRHRANENAGAQRRQKLRRKRRGLQRSPRVPDRKQCVRNRVILHLRQRTHPRVKKCLRPQTRIRQSPFWETTANDASYQGRQCRLFPSSILRNVTESRKCCEENTDTESPGACVVTLTRGKSTSFFAVPIRSTNASVSNP